MHLKNITLLIFMHIIKAIYATVEINSCEVLEGKLPARQIRLVAAWIEIHREELPAD